jgi:hypothetical protein
MNLNSPAPLPKQPPRVNHRGGWSHGGQFAQGFGAVEPKYVPAMLWTYQQVIEPAEIAGYWSARNVSIPQHGWLKQGDRSYDSIRQSWHAVVSFVNWPAGVTPVNPGRCCPTPSSTPTRATPSSATAGRTATTS